MLDISDDVLKQIKCKYGCYGSWAIWAKRGGEADVEYWRHFCP